MPSTSNAPSASVVSASIGATTVTAAPRDTAPAMARETKESSECLVRQDELRTTAAAGLFTGSEVWTPRARTGRALDRCTQLGDLLPQCARQVIRRDLEVGHSFGQLVAPPGDGIDRPHHIAEELMIRRCRRVATWRSGPCAYSHREGAGSRQASRGGAPIPCATSRCAGSSASAGEAREDRTAGGTSREALRSRLRLHESKAVVPALPPLLLVRSAQCT